MACGVVRKAVWTPSNRSEHGPNINGSLGLKTLALLLTLFVTNALGADQLIEIDTGRKTGVFVRSPVLQRAILSPPAQATGTALLFFRGWPGIGWIETAGDKARNLLPFMREAEPLLHAAGIALVIVDCPTDQWGPRPRSTFPESCDDTFRSSTSHAGDIRRLLEKLRTEHGMTDFYLLGHSYGSISSKWLALALGDEIRGSIHSAAMTVQGGGPYQRYGSSAALVPMEKIRARVLHLHHRQDACPNTPYAAVQGYAGENLVSIEGGAPTGSDPCGALHYHSYRGVERVAAEAVVRWITQGLLTPHAGIAEDQGR